MTRHTVSCRSLVLLCGLMASLTPHLQAIEDNKEKTPVDYQPLSLSAGVGTLGFSGTLGWRFSDHVGIRGGANYLKYDRSDEIEGIRYDSSLRLQSFPLGLDIYPSKSSSFRITVGALFNQNEVGGFVPPGQSVDIDGNTYSDPQLALNMKIEQQEISPFIAIGGNIYFDSGKHVALEFEFGVAYTGSPDVTLTRTTTTNPAIEGSTINADLEKERRELEEKAKDFKFYPMIKIGLTFSF